MNKEYLSVFYNTEKKPITNYPSQLVDFLIKEFNIKSDATILDTGCGRGDILKILSKRGFNVYGADIVCFDSGDNKISSLDFNTDVFPYPDNTFDLLFSKSVIEHISNTNHFLKELYRILKPGGRIIIMTPDWNSQMKIFFNDYTHVRPYTKVGLKNLLLGYNFEDVTSNIFLQYPLYWKYPILEIIPKILSILGPVRRVHKNKFYRFSRESMILASGIK